MKSEKKLDFMRNTKGITLISLTVTLIVIVIIGAITIKTVESNKKIIKKSKEAKEETRAISVEEYRDLWDIKRKDGLAETLDQLLSKMQNDGLIDQKEKNEIKANKEIKIGSKLITFNEDGNENYIPEAQKPIPDEKPIVNEKDGVKIPDGFHHVEGEKKEDGIVMADELGNEYVWIPVTKYIDDTPTEPYKNTKGKIREKSNIEIKLGRYFYLDDGTCTPYDKGFTEDTIESHKPKFHNSISKGGINVFLNSVKRNGGYFFGRYEAGIEGDNIGLDPEREDTQYVGNNLKLVSKYNAKPWTHTSQTKASQMCGEIANTNRYKELDSDLINSYSWDTAILFIQTCGLDSTYSRQTAKSQAMALVNCGTNILVEGKSANKVDKQCNIYDMAGNAWESSTETADNYVLPRVYRGGVYEFDSYKTARRYPIYDSAKQDYYGFRPILYYK